MTAMMLRVMLKTRKSIGLTTMTMVHDDMMVHDDHMVLLMMMMLIMVLMM